MNASFNNKNGEIVELVNTITAAKKSLYQNYSSTVNPATIFRYTYSIRDFEKQMIASAWGFIV